MSDTTNIKIKLGKKTKNELIELVIDAMQTISLREEKIEVVEEALQNERSMNSKIMSAYQQTQSYVDKLGEQYAGLSELTKESMDTGNRAVNLILDNVEKTGLCNKAEPLDEQPVPQQLIKVRK